MGEHAKFNGQDVKIGTCEDMYYLRADQADKVQPITPGNVDPIKDAEHLRFRFPFPDEDHIEPGSDGFWRNGFDRAVAVDVGDSSITCQKHPGAAVRIVQQRWVDAQLVLVVGCGPDCSERWRLPTLAEAEPVIVACRAEADRQPEQAAFWNAIADRIAAGYQSPARPSRRVHLQVVPPPAPEPAPAPAERGWVGEKYEATKGLHTPQIAALFRQDVKAAIAAGTLPKGLKLSVRSSSYSGGSSIRVTVTACPGLLILNPKRLESDAAGHGWTPEPWATAEASALSDALESLLKAYSFDHSDSQSDYFHVRFYGFVDFASELTRAERDRFEAERKAAAPELDAHGSAVVALLDGRA